MLQGTNLASRYSGRCAVPTPVHAAGDSAVAGRAPPALFPNKARGDGKGSGRDAQQPLLLCFGLVPCRAGWGSKRAWKENVEAVFRCHEPAVQLVLLTLLLEHFRASTKMPFGSPRLPSFAWHFSPVVQPLGKPGTRFSPQTPLRMPLADEVKPNCPKAPSSSLSHHSHGEQPLGQAYSRAQNWRNEEGWFSHVGGKQAKGCAISWDESASCGFPASSKTSVFHRGNVLTKGASLKPLSTA